MEHSKPADTYDFKLKKIKMQQHIKLGVILVDLNQIKEYFKKIKNHFKIINMR